MTQTQLIGLFGRYKTQYPIAIIRTIWPAVEKQARDHVAAAGYPAPVAPVPAPVPAPAALLVPAVAPKAPGGPLLRVDKSVHSS